MKYILLLSILILTSSCSSINSENKNILKGYFSYLADAALFIDCETNEKYPVAMQGDYITLEKEYLNVVDTAGQKVIVTLDGEYADLDKIEGEGKRKFLIVNKFIEIQPNDSCK